MLAVWELSEAGVQTQFQFCVHLFEFYLYCLCAHWSCNSLRRQILFSLVRSCQN